MNKYIITGEIDTLSFSDIRRPRQICLLDSGLKTIEMIWTTEKAFSFEVHFSGIYLIRIITSNGVESEQTVYVKKSSLKLPVFQPNTQSNLSSKKHLALDPDTFIRYGQVSSRKKLDSTFSGFEPLNKKKGLVRKEKALTGKVGAVPKRFLSKRNLIYISILNRSDERWSERQLASIPFEELDGKFALVDFDSKLNENLIVINMEGVESKLICCPDQSRLHIRLKYLADVVKGVHPLSAMLTSDYFKAETLLEMMNNGAMVEAQSFAVSGQAEDLLRDKITNPFAAAVGGYYLLKSRDLERMHDWANNLANWFPAFSDGAIIHAWQMIQEGQKCQSVIRQRLLEGQSRGIPIYTEGVKLLYEGLRQLSSISRSQDNEVEEALSIVSMYFENLDLSCKNTTINMHSRILNGWLLPEKLLGKPSKNID
ncbi:MAG: hypothetical protein EOO20_02840 [Chryseobacterium sp.]|uniref:hypothetical protein n=1 Tax=Pedobacter agri TaxID=454586 RepID=UPI00121C93B9|nr:hypothetical protein [Pedobacter agri]RZJ92123.1 MAG: hypothetical protein EOO20_02840 [Chryseobacterium sp.]